MATEKTELSTCGFSILPEDCVSYLLSFTSPCEVCRLSLVSKFFLAAAQTDLLWESFLPPDVAEILSRAANPVAYSSKKELYFHLCQPLLVDDGKRSFQLEKSTGRKTYMISPEIMRIVWVETPQYWRWISLPQSRFIKQAELLAVCWLEINCSIDSRLLSQKTMYTAYMIYKLNPDSYGLDSNSQKASIKFGVHSQVNRVTLEPDDEDDEEDDEEEEKQVQLREDGWLKMELGQIYNDQGNEGEIQINFLDVEELHWKKGLVFAGIEIRPTKRKVDAEFLR
ncbi:F-box protein At2g02240-like [Zingiber officinale]|uniref:F-box protein At2g02240-like n=1 Tax=Zingiber officinale TaxID=94328 RepID=UPI001C4AA1DC|nr:F-box protein At2g02240-like [Zingiber officinale]